MTHHEGHNPHPDDLFPKGIPGPDDHAGHAAAIRAAADGELTPEQLGALAGDEFAQSRIRFEQNLRAATARVMSGVAAPAGLRESILAAEAEQTLSAGLHARAAETRDRSFWAGQRWLLGAVATVLVLAVSAVFIMQSTRLIGPEVPTAYRTNLARFVTDEHTRTLDDRYAEAKYVYTAVDAAVAQIGGQLLNKPAAPRCGKKVQFRGASPCHVPGKGPSAHFQFTLEDKEGIPRAISMFVKQDHNEFDIAEDTAYLIDIEDCDLKEICISVWRRNGLLYTLVTEAGNADLCNDLLVELGVQPPDPNKKL